WRNKDRASLCLSDPVGWLDSSLRYRSMPHSSGKGTRIMCVSAERWASACTALMASAVQRRASSLYLLMSSTTVVRPGFWVVMGVVPPCDLQLVEIVTHRRANGAEYGGGPRPFAS